MRKKRFITTGFLAASILALGISFSQFLEPAFLFSQNEATIPRKEVKATPNDTETFVSLCLAPFSSFSLTAPLIIQSHLPSCFLFEIFTENEEGDEVYTEETSLDPNVFFEITFRLIICPNGP